MAQNYQIVDVPGAHNLKIATIDVSDADPNKRGVRSPEWMIKIDDLLKSDVDGFNDHCELFGWYGESSRLTTGDISGQLFTSSTLSHSDVVLLLPNGGHGAQIETKMNIGMPLENIVIARLGNVQNLKVKLQKIEFKHCRIQAFQQQLDRLYVFISPTIKTNTVFVYGNDGTNKGQMVSNVDYSKNTAQ
jgi:hypothetical protein